MRIMICSLVYIIATIFTVVQARALWRVPYGNGLGNGFGSVFSLRPAARVANGKMSTIKFSAYGKATLYVNGKQLEQTTSTTPVVVRMPLQRGDLVAFKAEKTGPKAGLMATISWGSKTYVTGKDRFTARGDYSRWESGEQLGWNSVVKYEHRTKGTTRTFCHWDRADKTEIKTGKFEDKASFIWRLTSKDGKQNVPVETTYFRLVVGGENCGVDPEKSDKDNATDNDDEDDKKSSHRVPKLKEGGSQSGSSYGIGGQSDSASSEGFCACRYTASRGGECFDMEDPTASSGKCKPRSCEPKFECAAAGDKICVKRRGGMKVVLVAPNRCITVFADDTESLIPYEG